MRCSTATLFLVLLLAAGLIITADPAKAASRPNFVIVQTDDQPRSLMLAKYRDRRGRMVPVMPNVANMIRQGTQFTNFYASTPVCGPARAALLTGQYGHNNRVIKNSGPNGGFTGWKNSHIYNTNLATELQSYGYETMHFGKFTNGYGDMNGDSVPPGWDVWMSDWRDDSTRYFYGYQMMRNNVRSQPNGLLTDTGPTAYSPTFGYDPKHCSVLVRGAECRYHTDVVTEAALRELNARSSVTRPFYMQIDFHAPHGDVSGVLGPDPASRHLGLAKRTGLPYDRNFNERNTTDKPLVLQINNGLLSVKDRRWIRSYYRSAIESLMSVDEAVGEIRNSLAHIGQADNTYFIFTSDNGYFHGDHRFRAAKFLAHEESSNVPFVVVGPGVRRATSKANISTVDVAPTVLRLAGAIRPSLQYDGMPIDRLWRNPALKPRRPVLIEYINETRLNNPTGTYRKEARRRIRARRPSGKAPAARYQAIKINEIKFIRYEDGGMELYDLRRDPHELSNQSSNPGYRRLMNYMNRQLLRYRACVSSGCSSVAPAPPKPGFFRHR